MSKYKAFKCDICGAEMQDNGRLLVKRRNVVGLFEGVYREWNRLDVCPKCTNDMLAWIKKQRTKDNERKEAADRNRPDEKTYR